jgi:hypothetical protein
VESSVLPLSDIAEYSGYRGILWISFGVSLTCGLLAPLLLPSPRINTGPTKHLDHFGAVVISNATASTVYAFNQAPRGWYQIRLLAPLVCPFAHVSICTLQYLCSRSNYLGYGLCVICNIPCLGTILRSKITPEDGSINSQKGLGLS